MGAIRVSAVLAVVGGLLAASPASAQLGRDKEKKPPQNQPGAGAPVAGGAVLRLTNPKELTARVELRLRMQDVDRGGPNSTGGIVREPFAFQSAALTFPLLEGSASHVAARGVDGPARGVLSVDGRMVSDVAELIPGRESGTRLGKWSFKDTIGSEVLLEVTVPVVASRTVYDDAAAAKLPWPASWPEEAASTFKPQLYVDVDEAGPVDMKPVRDLVERWTNKQDPKSVPPATLAKFLAGEVMRLVQVSGSGLKSNRSGEVEGFDLRGAVPTALAKRGSEFDLVCLLAAVYRQAGLPARIVIGYESGRGSDRDKLFTRGSQRQWRAWVEFALRDPASVTPVVWVPVDIVVMKGKMPQLPPLERPWPYFGTHQDLDAVVPLAFQFLAPGDVVTHGSPALFGWVVVPAPPQNVQQSIRVLVGTTPRRGGQESGPLAPGGAPGGGPGAAPGGGGGTLKGP